ncbi:hypothetical protein [Pseudoalteromonas sp. SG44-17]|uniref:hypothetical protein n=1 Tax=Pseudoalteromonas sp. SG44-17 TaxID=2760963 RepID=UPI0015FEC611|nr:hypothetical protein [Pseudoalteromonas sp. SG44-17]MBB1408616.1 hypothetical protein [Pseudoalteromonas sp. SG44-17]
MNNMKKSIYLNEWLVCTLLILIGFIVGISTNSIMEILLSKLKQDSLANWITSISTFAIMLGTIALACIAWKVRNSWVEEKKHNLSVVLLKNISAFYCISLELRKSQVQIFDLYENLKSSEDNDPNEAYKATYEKGLSDASLQQELLKIKSLNKTKYHDYLEARRMYENLEKEQVKYKNTALVSSSLVNWGNEAVELIKSIEENTVAFYEKISPDYKRLSKRIAENDEDILDLPKLDESILSKKYEGKYTFSDIDGDD